MSSPEHDTGRATSPVQEMGSSAVSPPSESPTGYDDAQLIDLYDSYNESESDAASDHADFTSPTDISSNIPAIDMDESMFTSDENAEPHIPSIPDPARGQLDTTDVDDTASDASYDGPDLALAPRPVSRRGHYDQSLESSSFSDSSDDEDEGNDLGNAHEKSEPVSEGLEPTTEEPEPDSGELVPAPQEVDEQRRREMNKWYWTQQRNELNDYSNGFGALNFPKAFTAEELTANPHNDHAPHGNSLLSGNRTTPVSKSQPPASPLDRSHGHRKISASLVEEAADKLVKFRNKINDQIVISNSAGKREARDPVYVDEEGLRAVLQDYIGALNTERNKVVQRDAEWKEYVNQLEDSFSIHSKASEQLSDRLQSELDREAGIVRELRDQQTFSLAISSFRNGVQWPVEKREDIASIIVNHVNTNASKEFSQLELEDVMTLLDENLAIDEVTERLQMQVHDLVPAKLFRELLFSGEVFNLGLVTAYLCIRDGLEGPRTPATLQDYLELFSELRTEWEERYLPVTEHLDTANQTITSLIVDFEAARDSNDDLKSLLEKGEIVTAELRQEIMLLQGANSELTAKVDRLREEVRKLQKVKYNLNSELEELREEFQGVAELRTHIQELEETIEQY